MNKQLLRLAVAFVTTVALIGCGGGGEADAPAPAAEAAPAAAPAAAGGATVGGLVSYSGDDDPDTSISMDADPVCQSMHSEAVETESVVAADGNLANVFVYVKEGLSGSYPAPAEGHVLDQMGCTYSPHVSGVQVNQELVIRNSDQTLHNVHALPTNNPEFNQGQPFQGMELPKKFANPEVMIRFKCDVHPWMSAYLGVLDHPFFAVSGTDGTFQIANLPAGEYVLEAWHETLGTQTQNVTVGADGEVAVAFDFS